MKLEDILHKLCYYDKRHPDFEQGDGKKTENCFCDNCFYGRTEMAEALLEQLNMLIEIHEKYAHMISDPDASVEECKALDDFQSRLNKLIKQATE